MIYIPGKVAKSSNPHCLHLCKTGLLRNFILLYWNYIGENMHKENILFNCYSFERRCREQIFLLTHLFFGGVGARVCLSCFSLWLGSFPGVSSGNIDGGERGKSEDNCFLPTIHPEQRSLKS